MSKFVGIMGISLAVSAALVGCGGNSTDTSASTGGTSGGTSGGVSTASTCTGTSRANASYDVFLPTASGITQSSANRAAQLYGQATDLGQCIAVSASSAQGDASAVQVKTTDDWNNAITYADPVGTSVVGGVKFNQDLFVTCKAGGDTFQHVGVANTYGSTSTFVSTNQVATAVKDTPLQSYECIVNGANSAPGYNTGSAVTFSSADGSVTVSDSVNGNTTIAAADVPSLFSQAGYNLNGKVLRWYLYQLPSGTTTKQVLVHTAQRTDGTYNIDLFLQQ